jgi:biopolymer transport protein ExbD
MGMRTKYQDHSTPGVNLSLIITPMLDMSFQILSFFIMTYHPSALEGHIPGSLAPPDIVAQKSKDNQVMDIIPPSVPEDMILEEIKEAMTVVLTLGQTAGAPGKIYIKTKLEQPDEVADADRDTWKVARQELSNKLKARRKDAGEKANIKIEAHGDILQDYVMQVYDTCKNADFPKIHFVPPPLAKKE